MPPPKIFISHPKEDAALAGALSDLLLRGCELSKDQVFCSSQPGVRIPAGADFRNYIREQLRDATLFVQLITPAYIDSEFCMLELGAAWVSKEIVTFPLIVPPSSFEDLDVITGGVEARRVNDRTSLDELFQVVADQADRTPDPQTWERERKKFLRALPRRLSDVSEPRKVGKALYNETVVALNRDNHQARYVGVVPLAEVSKNLCEAYDLLWEIQPRNFVDRYFLASMHDALVGVAQVFDEITANHCRAVIKWVTQPSHLPAPIDEWIVEDLARSDRSQRPRRRTNSVGNNSASIAIVENREPFFFSNDLPQLFIEGEYKNSSWTDAMVRQGNIDYHATIAVPVGRFLEDENQVGHLAAEYDLLGLLCIDAKSTNAFDGDNDVVLATTIASSLIPVLHKYRELTSS